MADANDFIPSAFAGEMQLRTRKEKDFDGFEASLPDPRSPGLSLKQFDVANILDSVAKYNPFGRPVNDEDIVWLFDNTAYHSPEHTHHTVWEAEFVAAVFEKECKCKVADIVSGIAEKLGLADDEEGKATIEERLRPFLWDVRPAKVAKVLHKDKELKLSPTSINGISTSTQRLEKDHGGKEILAELTAAPGADCPMKMETYYAEPEGWGVISDIDDTIKVTMTSDPTGILRSTFVDAPKAIPGMVELYSDIVSSLPKDSPWFYLSASPYNLYPFLREFRDEAKFPAGTMILRDSSWRTVSGLLTALTVQTEEYKADRMKKINKWLPKRKMIVFGDSTQSDPEAYGEIYRTIPGWIKMIFIRKATDVAAFGIDEKNQPERFERAFKDVPREAWHVFEDPAECLPKIRELIARDE